jgi:predicted DCC family thiol-disulfide oxidoreductase YuxK
MQRTAPAPSAADLTVFYDGDCPLCRSEIGLYRNCAGAERVAFVDVAAANAGDVAAGQVHSGAAGFAQLWSTLPGWRWLGRLTMLPGVRTVAEVAYRGFLLVRPGIQWLWRRTAPTPPAPKAGS